MWIEALAALLLGATVLWIVLQPLYRPASVALAYEEPEDPEETRRGIALIALKEIDFDRATGKLSDADYEFLKSKYTAEALAAIREEADTSAPAGSPGAGPSLRSVPAVGRIRSPARSSAQLASDHRFRSITEIWLEGDH